MQFIPVKTNEDIKELATMASVIWREYWPQLIGQEQTEYMVQNFQSEQALKSALDNEGYLYWLLVDEGRTVGYTGARPEVDAGKLFISKIYLYAAERGKGFASQVMRFYETYCREHEIPVMYLTVNKGNTLALRAYESSGFKIAENLVLDIGGGFIMDDYSMEKTLSE